MPHSHFVGATVTQVEANLTNKRGVRSFGVSKSLFKNWSVLLGLFVSRFETHLDESFIFRIRRNHQQMLKLINRILDTLSQHIYLSYSYI